MTLFVAVLIAVSASLFSRPTYITLPSPDGHSPCGSLPTGIVATFEKSDVLNTST